MHVSCFTTLTCEGIYISYAGSNICLSTSGMMVLRIAFIVVLARNLLTGTRQPLPRLQGIHTQMSHMLSRRGPASACVYRALRKSVCGSVGLVGFLFCRRATTVDRIVFF